MVGQCQIAKCDRNCALILSIVETISGGPSGAESPSLFTSPIAHEGNIPVNVSLQLQPFSLQIVQ